MACCFLPVESAPEFRIEEAVVKCACLVRFLLTCAYFPPFIIKCASLPTPRTAPRQPHGAVPLLAAQRPAMVHPVAALLLANVPATPRHFHGTRERIHRQGHDMAANHHVVDHWCRADARDASPGRLLFHLALLQGTAAAAPAAAAAAGISTTTTTTTTDNNYVND